MSLFEALIEDARHQPPLAYSYFDLASKYGFDYEQVKAAVGRYNRKCKNDAEKIYIRDQRYRELLKPTQATKKKLEKRNTERVLIIGDTHFPFCKAEYLDFCIETAKLYDVTHVIHIGDVIDNHFASYHETDPDGMSARDELDYAIRNVSDWVDAFPTVDVCIGNHDALVTRKAKTAGLSVHWVRDYNEVLGAPGWNFQEEFIYDEVRYVHGSNGSARNRAKKDLISTVQGHYHADAYVEYMVGRNFRIFGMQVGCGIDYKSYAMAYAKAGPKPAISVGVVLNHGQDAIIRMMKL